MQSAHSGNEPDSVNSGALSLVLGLVAVSTLAISLVVTALVRDEVQEVNAMRDLTQDADYRQLKASQLGALEAPAQLKDQAQGVVSVPIGRAMALTLEAVRRDPNSLSPWTTDPAAPSEELPTGAEPAAADAPSSATQKEAAPGVGPASPTAGTVDALTETSPVMPKASAAGNRGDAPAQPDVKPSTDGASLPQPH